MLCRYARFVSALPVALFVAGSAFCLQGENKPAGQEHGKPGDKTADDGQFRPMPRPTPEHASFKKSVGVWDAIAHNSVGPGQPITDSKGVLTATMHGEFWLAEEFKGEVSGMSFTAHGLTGYDPKTKKFMGTWHNSLNPELIVMEGTADEKTHVVTMTGEVTDPMSRKRVRARMTFENKDDNNRVFSMYQPGSDGKEWKCVTIEYVRRK